MKKLLLAFPYCLALIATTLFGTGVKTASAEQHCKPCPYSCESIGVSSHHCSYRDSNRPGFCCVDLDKAGMSQALLAEEQVNSGGGYGNGNGYGRNNNNNNQDHCPPGFSPSEQKCAPQERARGCKDIRLPSGLGCVNRR